MPEKLKNYLRAVGGRRLAGVMIGNFFIAVGVSIFKFTLLGNDPSSAMAMAVAARLHISFTLSILCFNACWFVVELLWGRAYIGVGTFVNWLLIGPVTDAFTALYERAFVLPGSLFSRILIMLAGVVVVCLGVSLYQTANVGVSPYDSISLTMRDRLPIQYFWCRMLLDAASAFIAWLLGGIVGVGTLTCAVGLGPVISFFDRTVSRPLLLSSCRKTLFFDR